jgi:oligopeptide transport system substrate-binding protein
VRCLPGLIAISTVACGLPEGDYFGKVPEVSDPKHLRWCNSGDPESLDPAYATTTTAMKLVYSMFDGLAVNDRNGLPVPGLASRWEVSFDLRSYTLHLRADARWSNGRPLDAYDVSYSILRVVHPSTASPGVDGLDTIKNAVAYAGNRVRKVLRDTAGLRAGDIVEIIAADGKPLADWGKEKKAPPDSNLRRSSKPLRLRDLGAAEDRSYAQVPAGVGVTLVELSDGPVSPPSPDGKAWAYVYWNTGDGLYGWVPLAELDQEPHADKKFLVRKVIDKLVPGLERSAEELAADEAVQRPEILVQGRDLLMLPEILGVRIVDRHTVVLENADPTPYFVNLLPNRSLRPTPREAVSRWPRRWIRPDRIVTSGPMHLARWLERDYVELVKSTTYWNPEEARLDRLTAYSLNDQSASANYYYTGGCDAIASNNIPSSYFPALNGEKRGRPYKDYTAAPFLGIYFAFINTDMLSSGSQVRKPTHNRHLRRALAYAVDRSVMPKILHGGQIPTAQMSPGKPIKSLTDEELALCGVVRAQPGVAMIMITGELCYVPPPGLDFDPERAKQELALARQEMADKFPSKLVYRYNTGVEGHKLIAEYLQQQWQNILGITVELESQEWKTFVADTRAGNYEVARFGNIGNFPDSEAEFLSNFRCESKDNRAKWCNPAFEAAMEAAKPIRDRKVRLEKIKEAERILLEDAPVIPLYVYTQHHLQKPYVRDLAINLPDQPPLHEAYLDPTWGGDDR